MIKSIFDGLMDYAPGTTDLVPGLAESYTISDDGQVFTFTLRPGVKFHNGREMTAEDVVYSLNRVTNPATQSPGAGFFGSIKGYDAVADGSASSLEGVHSDGPLSVTIELSRPDATFLHVLALNFASVGDTHAAQGDGEVCGTAIESPMDTVMTIDLVKSANLKSPRFTTPGPVTRHLDSKGYEVTTGIGPDLMTASRDAVSGIIDFLSATRGLAAEDAYMLISTCGDLRISEIVDMPNCLFSFYFPRCVFE